MNQNDISQELVKRSHFDIESQRYHKKRKLDHNLENSQDTSGSNTVIESDAIKPLVVIAYNYPSCWCQLCQLCQMPLIYST